MDLVGLHTIRFGSFIPVCSRGWLVRRRVARFRVVEARYANRPAGRDIGAIPDTGRDRYCDGRRCVSELHLNLGSWFVPLSKRAEVESEQVGEVILVEEVDPFPNELGGDLARVERRGPFRELEGGQIVSDDLKAGGVHVAELDIADISGLG